MPREKPPYLQKKKQNKTKHIDPNKELRMLLRGVTHCVLRLLVFLLIKANIHPQMRRILGKSFRPHIKSTTGMIDTILEAHSH